jgi:hypothetical protein
MTSDDLPLVQPPPQRPAGVPESIHTTLDRVARQAGPEQDEGRRALYWRTLAGGNVGWPPAVKP